MPDVRATHCTRHGPSTYSLRLATMSTSIQTRMSVSVELPADDSGANDSIAPLFKIARNDRVFIPVLQKMSAVRSDSYDTITA